MDKTSLLQQITTQYLESRDFNGLPVQRLGGSRKEVRRLVAELIRLGNASVNFGDRHPNPHILAFDPESTEKQLAKLPTDRFEYACLYPTESHLRAVVPSDVDRDRPFTLKLRLGEPQLRHYSFDLSVLESYRNDPRYYFETDDVSGSISVHSKFYESSNMAARDQVFLESFGFAYDEDYNRCVSVFLRYLQSLSPEHQRIWNAKLLDGKYFLHPDYYRPSILGEFPERVSIFVAFVAELHQINKMATLMGRSPLFRSDYRDKNRPRQFSFLIRPTAKEFHDFVHLLDKMISDNIDRSFFGNDIALEREEKQSSGKVKVIQKGSIHLLDEWLDRKTCFPDPRPKNEMIATFKRIRRLRQRPAHNISDDAFDQAFFRDQRLLVIDAYGAIRTLRLILANYPATKSLKVPDWLYEGRIWTY